MVPAWYEPDKIGTMFRPNLDLAVQDGRDYARKHNIPAAASEGAGRMILAVIDMQADFINPPTSNYPGSLCVPGAVGDVDRLCRFIFANVGKIDHIVASLDTHHLFQPFHPYHWQAGPKPAVGYQPGDHPAPFTIIRLTDVQEGMWMPTRNPRRIMLMLKRLEQERKKNLCIWPLHCLRGTAGQALDPVLMQLIHFHAGCRNDKYHLTPKGLSHTSEHYGILKAEVTFDDDWTTQLNMEIVNQWQNADRIYFAGEAKSHCVMETLNQVAEYFGQNSPDVLDRLFVLEDCMSNVPDIVVNGKVIVPFAQMTKDRFAELSKLGFKFVKSTDQWV